MNVDVRRAGRVVVAVCLVALAVTGVILLVAGVQNNDQIDNLRHHGVPVAVTVTGCLGLMGGTGAQCGRLLVYGDLHPRRARSTASTSPALAFHAPGGTIHGDRRPR